MSFKVGTVIIEKETNASFKVLIQDKNKYALAPRKIYGFSKKPDEWIFIWSLDEENYRIDSNYEVINNALDFFQYSTEDDYTLTDEEFAVLMKCQERDDYVPNSLLTNIFLISSFAEMLQVNKGELVKKLVCIGNFHPDYEESLYKRIKENIEIRDRGIDLLGEFGHS